METFVFLAVLAMLVFAIQAAKQAKANRTAEDWLFYPRKPLSGGVIAI